MRARLGVYLGGALLTLALGYYFYWFSTNFERRDREVRTGESQEAKRNPLLAAERFLTHIGRDAESVSGRDRLLDPPVPGDALLVNSFGANLPPDREAVLLDWLERGGHLILAPARLWDEDSETGGSHFLDRFGIRLESDTPCGCGEDEEVYADEDVRGDEEAYEDEDAVTVEDIHGDTASADETLNSGKTIARKGVLVPGNLIEDDEAADPVLIGPEGLVVNEEREEVSLTPANSTLPKTLSLDSDRIVHWDGDEESDRQHSHMIELDVGAGRLTVLSAMNFLHNERIVDQDHALFLATLTQDADKVWLLYTSNMPSLLALLWTNQPYLIVSLSLSALLWLWSLTGFTGALREPGNTRRRNLLEHLDAAAAYAWRTDRARRMAEASRESVLRPWILRHPELQDMAREPLCERIAEYGGLTSAEVDAALFGGAQDERELINMSVARQRLLAALSRRKKEP